jgi:hypothetical protein
MQHRGGLIPARISYEFSLDLLGFADNLGLAHALICEFESGRDPYLRPALHPIACICIGKGVPEKWQSGATHPGFLRGVAGGFSRANKITGLRI